MAYDEPGKPRHRPCPECDGTGECYERDLLFCLDCDDCRELDCPECEGTGEAPELLRVLHGLTPGGLIARLRADLADAEAARRAGGHP